MPELLRQNICSFNTNYWDDFGVGRWRIDNLNKGGDGKVGDFFLAKQGHLENPPAPAIEEVDDRILLTEATEFWRNVYHRS